MAHGVAVAYLIGRVSGHRSMVSDKMDLMEFGL